MKTKLLVLLLVCAPFLGIAQNSGDSKKLIRNISLDLFSYTHGSFTTDNTTLDMIEDFNSYLKTIGKIGEINSLSGSINFGIIGNESDNADQYTIQSGMNFNSGLFPLNVEASMNIQTQIQNGEFNEVVSNIDLSVDYLSENTTHEGYAFVIRSRNTFLGVNQRYEIGGGYVANLFKSTMKEGQALINSIKKWEGNYSKNTLDNIDYYTHLKKTFGADDIEKLFTETEKHKNTVKVKYSRYRFAFLIGFNTEVEQTKENLELYANDSTFTNNFKGTTIFRLVLAPKFELRGEKFKWSNTLFGKIRVAGDDESSIDNTSLITDPNDFRESKLTDFWIQFQSKFEFKLSKSLSLLATINYIYDNAPKRQFYLDANNSNLLAFAEQRYLGTAMSLKYSF
ncbi:hypothetical protein H2O64_02050 [Kordia sp. YSTF-M3]|uniref:DUF3078 domain-containing protein n=1 Tax=Kordia aestuariivivens TaxID=2759037 RepID=A0ABR7Q4F0_9FLAO|nr:hypothetical protein [Kordia aestuariivivens]MBC8753435.1 hypothetical protein [Kordia aestuariivivens]